MMNSSTSGGAARCGERQRRVGAYGYGTSILPEDECRRRASNHLRAGHNVYAAVFPPFAKTEGGHPGSLPLLSYGAVVFGRNFLPCQCMPVVRSS